MESNPLASLNYRPWQSLRTWFLNLPTAKFNWSATLFYIMFAHKVPTNAGRTQMPIENLPGSSSILRGYIHVLAALVACFAGAAQAGPIKVDLGPSHTVTSQTPSSFFDDLNGTGLNGQALPVDFSFLHEEFVRIFSVTSSAFQVSLKLQTNSSSFVGFLDGTGYLIDINGNAIPGFGITGSASGSDGWMAISLFPLVKDEDGTPNDDLLRPFDFYGVHFALEFPDDNDNTIFVTSGEFSLSDPNGGVFGIGPGIPENIVPDSGGTLLLLGIALLLSIGLKTRLSNRKHASD